MFNLKPPEFNRKQRLFPHLARARGTPLFLGSAAFPRGLPLELGQRRTGSNIVRGTSTVLWFPALSLSKKPIFWDLITPESANARRLISVGGRTRS